MSPLAWALAGWLGAVASTTIWALRPSCPAETGPRSWRPRLLLLRPCSGAEPLLARTLASSGGARTQSELAVRFAVASRDDAAFAIAEAAAARLSAAGEDARVVITDAVGPNGKADQLARALALEASRYDVVIVSDSDVDLAGVDLDALVAPLASDDTGAVWAPPIEVAPTTLGDRASCGVLSASLHAFPLLATLDPGALVGKLFALRADTLERVGGFGALRRLLGEDMELARRLRAAGLEVVVSPVVARSCAQGRSLAEVVSRYARWASVIRAQRPGLILSYPFVLAFLAPSLVLGFALSRVDPAAAWLPLVALAVRAFVALAAWARSGRRRPLSALVVDALLAELVLSLAFVLALSSQRVSWRGRSLRVSHGGLLEPVEPT